ncbi:O-antigen polymerase [Thomasclavelia ramosa]|uniref:O-antigen polymerase n=1 Tax=Thomasclavelia ramosa TaxID=1547 RepID=UPI0022E6CB46|nr:O-antigen polymerase [Thomasclavelia ramosa]
MILLLLFFIFVNYKKHITWFSMIQVHNLMWLVAFILYFFNFVGYYPMNERIYLYSFIYIIFFNLFFLNSKVDVNKYLRKNFDIISKKMSNSIYDKRCIISSVIAYFLSFNILSKSLPILFGSGNLSDGMNLLRYQTYTNISIFNTFDLVLMSYIIRPIFVVTILLFSLKLATKTVNLKLTFFALLDALMLIAMTAGRALIISMIIYVVAAFLCFNKVKLSFIKKYKKYLLLIIPVFIFFIFISSQRVNRNNGVIVEFLIYIFSGLPYMSKLLEACPIEPFTLMGKGVLSPIFDTIGLLLRFFGFNSILASQTISHFTSTSLYVADGIQMNAAASTLLTFYLDFGIYGVALGASLVAIFSKKIEKLVIKNPSCLNLAIYLFVFVSVILMVQNYTLGNASTLFTIIFIIILLR